MLLGPQHASDALHCGWQVKPSASEGGEGRGVEGRGGEGRGSKGREWELEREGRRVVRKELIR